MITYNIFYYLLLSLILPLNADGFSNAACGFNHCSKDGAINSHRGIKVKSSVNEVKHPDRKNSSYRTLDTDMILFAIKRNSLLQDTPNNFIDQKHAFVVSDNELQDSQNSNKWKEKLLRISNIASLLCVVDCTVLPIVTLMLPLLGMGGSPVQTKFFHDLGHASAMFFVLPVGSFASYMNFISHKSTLLSSFSVIGLLLIYLANVGGGPLLSLLPHKLACALHCGGSMHRIFNIIGCTLLLGSNHFSRKLMSGCAYSGVNLSFGKAQKRLTAFVCCGMPGCLIDNEVNKNAPFFTWK